jgi:hypothetical protein
VRYNLWCNALNMWPVGGLEEEELKFLRFQTISSLLFISMMHGQTSIKFCLCSDIPFLNFDNVWIDL